MKKNMIRSKKGLLLFLFLISSYLTTFAQTADVTGKVSDESGLPIPGVNITIIGTLQGTITNIDGVYSIQVPSDAQLQFNFIGFAPQIVDIKGRTVIDIVLRESSEFLDEIVAIGYGVQKKKLTTGSTIQVDGEDLQKLSTVSVLGALQSQAPGVNITQSSGMPGEGFKVTVRGLGTVGSSSPLYVIDGVAGGDINSLNPSDIESVDVLKDAASAAIYGARAANGVILITTRQGKVGKMQISYDGYFGIQNPYKMASLLNAKEYMAIQDEINFNIGNSLDDWETLIPGLYQKIQGGWEGTNWLEETRNKNAPIQNHAVNVTGGTDISKFSMGFSYSDQEGILGKPVHPKFSRYTARINSSHIVYKDNGLDIIKLGQNLSFNYNKKSGIGIGNIYSNDIHNMLVAIPLMPVYDESGNLYNQADKESSGLDKYWGNAVNPIADMVYNRGQNLSKNYGLSANAYLEVQPIKDLIIKSSFGYRTNSGSYRRYKPQYDAISANLSNDIDEVRQQMDLGHSWTWENTVSYSFDIGSHSFNALVGQSLEKWGIGEEMDVTNGNSIFTDFEHAWLTNTKGVSSSLTSVKGRPSGEGALQSYFGRVNYNYNETYMASLVLRADGSSNFGNNEQWGFFPSFSAGWVITNEDFMSGLSGTLDFLKLRGSWGQNGNSDIDDFQYLATISFSELGQYSFGNDKENMSTGAFADILANKKITWETSQQLDLGFDARLLGSRLGVTFDWYKKTTKDWLVKAPQLGSYGTGAPFINGGDVENTGVEVVFNWNERSSEFTYGISLNFAVNKNKVTRIANREGIIHGEPNVLSQGTGEMYRAEVGKPIGYFWGYKTKGVFQNQAEVNAARVTLQANPQPGDLIFVDTNGDNVINEEDKVEIGDPNPDVTAGISLSCGYKGFDFSLTANGAFGHQIAKSYRSFADNVEQNFTTEIFKRWHGEGTSNKLPRLSPGSNANWQNISDIYIEDADFMKIQNVTVGYDFKKLWTQMPLSQARLYISAQNLFTITGYSGMDPEIGYGYDESWVSGIDLGFYPSPRTYLIGVNLKF